MRKFHKKVSNFFIELRDKIIDVDEQVNNGSDD